MEATENLMRLLLRAPRMIGAIRRWTHFENVPRDELETTLEHTVSAVYLAATMLAIEEKRGKHQGQLNHARVLLAAALHDVGEGRIGDVAFKVKQRPEVRDALRAIEIEETFDMLGGLPPDAAEYLMDAYRLEDEKDTLEGRFFNAIEVVGYMYVAIPMLRDRGHKDFLGVFRRQAEPIERHAAEFASVEELYAPYRHYVRKELELAERAKGIRERIRDAAGASDDRYESVSLRSLLSHRLRAKLLALAA